MNKLTKLGVSALAGSLAVTAAHSTEYAVTGDAVLKYSSSDYGKGGSEAQSGKGFGVDTDLYFNASGELDNGFTVSFFQAANTHSAWSNSSSQVTIGMGSMGTVQFNNVAGAKANGIDDVTPNAYNETWDGLSPDNPSFFGASTASGSVDYRIPTQEMYGATINASITYDPNADEAAPAAGDHYRGPGESRARRGPLPAGPGQSPRRHVRPTVHRAALGSAPVAGVAHARSGRTRRLASDPQRAR